MLQDILVTAIRPSPTNPRKTFRGLDDLAKSMAAVGQIDAVMVRPLPKEQQNGITHELVVGERRWRAAPLAKMKTISAVVRELDDKQVAEIQIVENDQREDVHPLEQAEGYRSLREVHGYSVEQIATKVSRTVGFVLGRLKLCTLTPEVQAAFLAEAILPGVATLIARIPDAALQREALKRVAATKQEPGLVSVGEARDMLRNEFMLKLADAPFDRADAKLVETAGACTTCPKRTGAQAELFADVDSPDLCTDPKCYRAKTVAHWGLVKLRAKEEKQPVLSDAEIKKVFPYESSDQAAYSSGFVSADDVRWLGGKSTKVSVLVGKDVKPTLALTPTGKVAKLYPKDVVDKAEKSVTRSSSSSTPRTPDDKAFRAKQELEKVGRRAVTGALVGKFEKLAALGDEHVRLMILCLGQDWHLEELIKRRGLKSVDAKTAKQKLSLVADAATTLKGGPLLGLLFECVLVHSGDKAHVDAAAKLLKVDTKAVDEAARAAHRAEKKEKAARKSGPVKKLDPKKAAAAPKVRPVAKKKAKAK